MHIDFADPADLAAAVSVLGALVIAIRWLTRRWATRAKHWIRDEIEDLIGTQVMPHLKNGETSVATYAHQARDAAQAAGQAALEAKGAALEAKSAALSAAAAAQSAETLVRSTIGK